MKYVALCSISLTALISLGFTIGLSRTTFASVESCRGAECNEKNPVEYRCNLDAVITAETTLVVNRRLDNWQPRQITIQKLYSEICRANWTRAYVPEDTYLFIREQDPVEGSQPTHGIVYARGAGYFWADSNMANGNVENQACISLSTGIWFWFERYCTDFTSLPVED
jgi:hypothetical protein